MEDSVLPSSSPPSPGSDAKRWIGLIIVGLVLGEAISVLVVSLTKDVLVPLMAMAMGGDTTSPLSLGKPDFNFPDILVAVLQLCVAGIIAICLNFFLLRRPKVVAVSSLSLASTGLTQPVQAAPPAAQKVPAKVPGPAPAAPGQTPSWATTTAEVSIKPTPLAAQEPIVVPPQTAPVKPAVAAPQTAGIQATAPVSRPVAQAPAAPRPQPPTPVASPPTPPPAKPQPKKPKEVYYNIVGERITPEDDE
jgi:large-conductance mechanosensitive channel